MTSQELFKDLKTPPAAGVTGDFVSETAPENQEGQENNDQPSEMELLKRRASMMGIKFSNNIGLEALREKIKETMESAANTSSNTNDAQITNDPALKTVQSQPADVNVPTNRPMTLREHLLKEKTRLVRVRITNLDPKKKDLPGEIITVANEHLGTIKKFVPFGEVTDNGYHIPFCIYELLKERTFVSIKTRKDSKGNQIVEHQDAREFALDVLEPLTPEELARMAAAQAASGNS